jgi:pimeloyl-ACP methyl ester carboxylesterase
MVYTPTLTGLGDRTHLMNESVNLTTHVNDVLSLLRFEELDRVVLAGHSHGGLVISGVAESAAEKIASLVYLDALVPGFPRPEPPVGGAPPNPGDTIPINEDFARAIGIPPQDMWKYSPHPVNSFIEEFDFTGAHSLVSRKVFVWANQWPNRESTYRALQRDPAWMTYEVVARHMLMLDAPNEVAEILESAI